MSEDTTVKIGDWIEREVALGYCPWAKIVWIIEPEWVSVVYLDGDTLVKDDMILDGGQWRFKYQGPSGFKIREAPDVKRWRATLREGPPFRILPGSTQLVYDHTRGTVWRRGRSVESFIPRIRYISTQLLEFANIAESNPAMPNPIERTAGSHPLAAAAHRRRRRRSPHCRLIYEPKTN